MTTTTTHYFVAAVPQTFSITIEVPSLQRAPKYVKDNGSSVSYYVSLGSSSSIRKTLSASAIGLSISRGNDGNSIASNTKYNFTISGTLADTTPQNFDVYVSYLDNYKDVEYEEHVNIQWGGVGLSFDANGGAGAPDSQSISYTAMYEQVDSNTYVSRMVGSTTYGTASATLSSTIPTRDGYSFVGWGTSASDTTPTYQAGGTISISADTTLYALWSKNLTLAYDANGGTGAPSSDTGSTATTTTPTYTTTISTTKPTRDGYYFVGWSDTKS